MSLQSEDLESAPRPNINAIIGDNVHRLMWRAHETQTFVAENVLGITQGALGHKIRGRRPWFGEEIDAIAKHYKVGHAALFTALPDVDENAASTGVVRPTGLEPMTSTV